MDTAPNSTGGGAATDERLIRLRLLDAFRLDVGGIPFHLPLGTQRLVAFLALRPHPLGRSFVAGTLWPEVPEERASANLRSALWRLRGFRLAVIESRHGTVALGQAVEVDLHEAVRRAARWEAGRMSEADIAAGTAALEGELLPDWDDDFVTAERERFRQVRLHGLEAMSERMIERGHIGDALLAALAAVLADPLRESAHRALINVHLADGNVAEAVRQLRRCERLLSEELGVAPSARLMALVGPYLAPPAVEPAVNG